MRVVFTLMRVSYDARTRMPPTRPPRSFVLAYGRTAFMLHVHSVLCSPCMHVRSLNLSHTWPRLLTVAAIRRLHVVCHTAACSMSHRCTPDPFTRRLGHLHAWVTHDHTVSNTSCMHTVHTHTPDDDARVRLLERNMQHRGARLRQRRISGG